MDSINYEKLIVNVVEAMLPTFSDRNVVLGMLIRSSFSYSGYTELKYFLLMFHRPDNYTKVLLKEYNNPQDLPIFKLKDGHTIIFNKESDHDSCWRSDGMRWIFKHWCSAVETLEKKGADRTKIDDINWNFGFDVSHIGQPKYYELEYPPLALNSRKNVKLKFKREIPLQEIHNFLPKD